MPHKLNLVEAVNYKERNPEYKVLFVHSKEDDYSDYTEYYEEELTTNRGEYCFRLREGFEYPSHYDHENSGWSNVYNRHLFGQMLAETEDEYVERTLKEIEDKQALVDKEQRELNALLERKKQEKARLDLTKALIKKVSKKK